MTTVEWIQTVGYREQLKAICAGSVASLVNPTPSLGDLNHHVVFARPVVFTFACALRRSAQYFFILWETARFAAADI